MILNTQQRFWLRLSLVGLVIVALCVIFPRALAFAEMAAREIRYLWWLILLVVFGGWLIWLSNKKIP